MQGDCDDDPIWNRPAETESQEMGVRQETKMAVDSKGPSKHAAIPKREGGMAGGRRRDEEAGDKSWEITSPLAMKRLISPSMRERRKERLRTLVAGTLASKQQDSTLSPSNLFFRCCQVDQQR